MRPLLPDRFLAGVGDGRIFTAEDGAVASCRVYDAESGQLVENVAAFRLSDSTLWVLDVEAWRNDFSDNDEAHIRESRKPFLVRHPDYPSRAWYSQTPAARG